MLNLRNIALLALNTQALGIKSNLQRILEAVKQAHSDGKKALFASELCVCGVECHDMFFSAGFIQKIQYALADFQAKLPEDFVVGLGVPQYVGSKPIERFAQEAEVSSKLDSKENDSQDCCENFDENAPLENTYVVFTRDKILLTTPNKLAFTCSRTDYSSRYFVSDLHERSPEELLKKFSFEYEGSCVLIAFGEVGRFCKLGANSCDLAIMPLAHGYEVDRASLCEQEALCLSKALAVPVARVNNLGCEAGSQIYDGQCLMVEQDYVVSRNALLSFKPYELVYGEHKCTLALPLYDEMLKAVALGLYDWLKKTHSKGYALSLSGGADSALCATAFTVSQIHALEDLGTDAYIAELMDAGIKCDFTGFKEAVTKAQEKLASAEANSNEAQQACFEAKVQALKTFILPEIFVCVYQGSAYSGSVTFEAAKNIAAGTGARFYNWSIKKPVETYVACVSDALGYELTWESDDISLQNIQARARLPGIWLLANHKGFLLMATSNLSEAAVGYCTMDGDTAGGLSPIAGIGKSTILQINKKIAKSGVCIDAQGLVFKLPEMSYIVAQAPTAELRPGGEQTDEKDLMPYPLLDTIRRLFTNFDLLPEEIAEVLIAGKDSKFKSVTSEIGIREDNDIRACVQRFFRLFQRNQWKRERFATSFHIESDDASPKSYLRFPVLSAALY